MTDELPKKLPLTSMDVAAEKRDELRRILAATFPEAVAEGKIDLDQLKRVLGDWAEPDRERFGLNWPGKAACMKVIQAPSVGTLKPCPEDSVDWETTENLFIEGDNLEVLKLLQKAYFGKIKMIYIDPPYNTGKEFIYPDKYAETLDTYLSYTGQIDEDGRKFSTNTESSGRFHSRWLSMMYPRLYLARNLLTEDGVIFVSIDDNEVANLKLLCNEILGEENFIAMLAWERGRKNDAKRFSTGHEYIVVYAKNLQYVEELVPAWREPKEGVGDIVDKYKELKATLGDDYDAISQGLVAFYRDLPINHPSKKYARSRFVDARGIWRDNNISWPGGGGPKYEILHPVTKQPCKIPDDGWRFVERTMKEKIRDGYVQFRDDHTKSPFLKSYLYVDADVPASEWDEAGEKLQVMGSVFYRHSQPSNDIIKGLFGEKIFENPKDHEILMRLIRYCTGKNDIILDFFAGSGSTAQAVLELNEIDRASRKFILVQLPEPTERSDYPTIADIAKERIRRVATQITNAKSTKLHFQSSSTHDAGFRAFKLGRSNFRSWNGDVDNETQLSERLDLFVDHIDPECSADAILFELLLKDGFTLATHIEPLEVAGKEVFSIANGALLICLDKELTDETMSGLADLDPSRVICLDVGFRGNDQLKANAVQTFKARARSRETAIEFRTV